MDNTDNFLKSIKKHSEEQRSKMMRELEKRKTDEINKAKIKGEADAYQYVQKLMAAKKTEITSEYAVKNFEADSEIFKKRNAMAQQVFLKAKDELDAFVQSDKYKDKLINDAQEISKLFSENSCYIYIKPDDMKYADDIKSVFNSCVEIKTDVKILIGGLRGYCENKKLVADNTLDSKLEAQKEWFIENAQLKVK